MNSKVRGCLWACGGCLVAVVTVLVIAVVGLRVTFKGYRQGSGSMEPTLAKGDLVLTRPAREIERGDLIVFRRPGERAVWMKRVIGMPGDRVEVRESSAIVNGIALDEPYIKLTPEVLSLRNVGEITVPPDNYYVLGDNRDNSNDSRYIGTISREQIVAKVVLVVSDENGVWQP